MRSIRLTREVRYFTGGGEPRDPSNRNTWSGTPPEVGELTFRCLRARVQGIVDARTGYLCDIKEIDDYLKRVVIPGLRSAESGIEGDHPTFALQRILVRANDPDSGWTRPLVVRRLELLFSPHLSIFVDQGRLNVVFLTQSFEFAAAHRLSCADLDEADNRALFGQCSNPHGHGHNYVVDVTVGGEPDPRTGVVVDLPTLNRVVRRRVLDDFDHRNLNTECPEFATLNPTVENIARVIWNRLHDALAPAELVRVRVWETPRTYADCGTES